LLTFNTFDASNKIPILIQVDTSKVLTLGALLFLVLRIGHCG